MKLPLGVPDEELSRQLAAASEALGPWLSATRRSFHRQAELGWQEFSTTASIVDELSAGGWKVVAGRAMLGDVARLGLSAAPRPGEGDTGCVAIFDSGRPGPTVCFRVDIDALPIREAGENHRPTDEGWNASEPSAMHACGHDGHIAIGLGVARLMAGFTSRLSGKLLILFQPAEEGGRGARAVVDAGWMAGVDLLVAVHVGLGAPTGSVALGVGGFLATRKFAARLTGRPAHAGKSPEQGRNALLAACQAALGLHSLAQSGLPGVRVNVGTMKAGGSLNIVPQEAEFGFEIRAATSAALLDLEDRCRRMIEATASAWGVASEIDMRGEASDWTNPKRMADWGGEVNRAVAAFAREIPDFQFGASEDATLLARAVTEHGGEAAIFVLGADLASDHHTARFDFDEQVLRDGVLLVGGLLLGVLDPGLPAG